MQKRSKEEFREIYNSTREDIVNLLNDKFGDGLVSVAVAASVFSILKELVDNNETLVDCLVPFEAMLAEGCKDEVGEN